MELQALVREYDDLANASLDEKLEHRVNSVHLRQRLGIESDHAADIFGQGRTFFHPENWSSLQGLLRVVLKATGLYRRGRDNARALRICHNEVVLSRLPSAFDGFTLLQLSDLHLDMDEAFLEILIDCLQRVEYDLCVMTGDFRAKTFGDYGPALDKMAQLVSHLQRPVYGILGNHDSIKMVPTLEEVGVRMLLNESVPLHRKGAKIYLAGIDDPHYFRVENFEKAAQGIPPEAVSVLLSHSPETYRRAAHAGFDLMLSGHTHGGQICLPGGVPLITNADCPRRFCAGPWRYQGLQGYTSVGSGASVVEVRFNCPPEISLHHLRAAPRQ